jgi:large subunit ribosomal protein L6
MSRIGKVPIQIPSGVTVEVDNDFITVNGPKGSLSSLLCLVLMFQ